MLLRSKLYPRLLGKCGRNVTFGSNVVLRHPHKIRIGDNVVIDDNCCLDAKGSDNEGITIGSGVFVGRNTILSCKNGDIILDDKANIGFNAEIFAASRVRVGKSVLVAAYCYLVGGDHLYDRIDIPVLDQGRTARGIEVDDNAWLGHARGGDRRLARGQGRDHRRRRRRDRRGAGLLDRGGRARPDHPQPASTACRRKKRRAARAPSRPRGSRPCAESPASSNVTPAAPTWRRWCGA